MQELLREVRQQLKDSQEQAELAQAESQELRSQLGAAQRGAAEQQQRMQDETASVQARGPLPRCSHSLLDTVAGVMFAGSSCSALDLHCRRT